jgi:hypothetical protein
MPPIHGHCKIGRIKTFSTAAHDIFFSSSETRSGGGFAGTRARPSLHQIG